MIALQQFKKDFSAIDFREKRPGIYKVLMPFFYEDGDMYDIFIEDCKQSDSLIRISDHGLTLMKLSYDFDLDTAHKQKVLESIISQNKCSFDKGDIFLDVTPGQLEGGIYQFAQTITKVSNMDIISKEFLKSCFYEFLANFVTDSLMEFGIKKDITPTDDPDLKVDFEIPAKRPIYLFGVKDDAKASKVLITCLNFANKQIPFKSLVVPENLYSLNSFNQNQIINVVDKSYTNLDQFKKLGPNFIRKEIA